jgi:HEPN domain-containing protein
MATEHTLSEAKRWFRQAEDDLAAARILTANQKFAQACFLCQQAGEKAMKAIWFWTDEDPWGHSVVKLIDDLEKESLRSRLLPLRSDALQLDRLYIPTRYPNGLPDLIPLEAFSTDEAEIAEKAATRILEVVRELLRL